MTKGTSRRAGFFLVGLLSTWQLGSAAQVQYVYDEAGRLKQVVYDDSTQKTYSLDPAGNRKQVTTTLPAGILQFATASPSPVVEGTPTFSIAVNRLNSSNGAIAVNYATADGSATSGPDYTATSGTLNWAAGDATAKTITVQIANDSSFENAEAFTLTLSAPTGGAILGSPTQVNVTLNDNDAVSFSVANLSVNEGVGGGTATVTVTKNGASSLSHNVNYATSNGSATAGSDYTAASGTLTFTSSDTTKTFLVPITSDSTYEGNETFDATLSSPTAGATLNVSSATVTITDDDAAPVFTIFPSSIMEGPPIDPQFMVFQVTKSGGTAFTHTVAYATSNGTAIAGQDYTNTSGTFTFAPAETSKTFSVPITTDGVYENSETFNVTLSSPSNGATLAGSPATGTILNSTLDPVPTFTIANASVNENAGLGSVTVTRNGASQATQGVSYATGGGTATAGSDYTSTSGSLSFASGVTSMSFNVSILDDSTMESTESIGVSLNSPNGGAALGSPSSASLQITDNDVPAVTISNMSYSSSGPGETTATYQFAASGDIMISPPSNPNTNPLNDAGDWLSPKVPNASAFDVMAVEQSGSNCSSGPRNAWTVMTPGITWTATTPGGFGATRNCTIQITIRNASTQVQAGTALISFTAVSSNPFRADDDDAKQE